MLWLLKSMKKQSKSPIKDKPLRYVGQSLDDKIDKLINEDAVFYIMASVFAACLAGYEWLRFYKQVPPSPKSITICAILVVFFSVYKIRKILIEVKAYKLGRDGERVV
ncbi:MAG: hypothetical protein HW390_3396, partial [Candidatus Brocadiaceae bacterium]|nr:hypothetical protein [Candidatus Brocadiaceae bacterium]